MKSTHFYSIYTVITYLFSLRLNYKNIRTMKMSNNFFIYYSKIFLYCVSLAQQHISFLNYLYYKYIHIQSWNDSMTRSATKWWTSLSVGREEVMSASKTANWAWAIFISRILSDITSFLFQEIDRSFQFLLQFDGRKEIRIINDQHSNSCFDIPLASSRIFYNA